MDANQCFDVHYCIKSLTPAHTRSIFCLSLRGNQEIVLFKSGITYHTTGMVKKTHPKCGVCRQSCYSSEIICLLGKMNIKQKQAVSLSAVRISLPSTDIAVAL